MNSASSKITSHHLCAIIDAQLDVFDLDAQQLNQRVETMIIGCGLLVVGFAVKSFIPQGLSIVYLLAESHVALHLWPEHAKVTVDIHVCDFCSRNIDKANLLKDCIATDFAVRPSEVEWSYLQQSS